MICLNSIRHSFTSALANAGVSPELRMKLTYHKSAEVYRGYTHLEMDTLKEKWTPKFGPVAKLDFSGSAGHERTAEL
jgi:site-specific recombinase XerD